MSTRAERLIATLEGAGIDLLLVSNLINVRYLTGYTGSNGLVLIGANTRVFLTDFRYTQQAEEEVYPEFERVTVAQNLVSDVVDYLPEGSLRVGYESETVTVDAHERARELFPQRVELVAVKGLVENMRLVKDEHEIELIAAAQKIADDAFEALLADGLEDAPKGSARLLSSTTCACVAPSRRASIRSSPAAVTVRYRMPLRAT